MAVTLFQNPGPYNLVHGPNAVTLSNLGAADKYVLQLWDTVGPTKFADIRQNANIAGSAQFDIQNLLEVFTSPSMEGIESIDKFTGSAPETFKYNIKYGSETDGVVTIDGTVGYFIALNGRKEYYEVEWNETPWRTQVSTDGESPCTQIDIQGLALTDWSYYKLGSQITDGKPSSILNTDKVYIQKVRPSDNFTISYLQSLVYGSSAPLYAVGLEALRFDFYNEAGVKLTDIVMENIIANGGGPNTAIGDGDAVDSPYLVVTGGVGPNNTYVNTYMPVGTHHYYVSAPVWNDPLCAGDYDELTDRSGWVVYRFDLIDDACNDFTPIQFSWMNSYGFRDYFQFQKRNERSVNITRNDFLKENNDYSTLAFNVTPGSRGYTTYSQKLEQVWTAQTRFVEDYEAQFLENLFISPDVRVRFGDDTQWYPVTLLSTQYVERNYRKDKLFQYDIEFKMANNKLSQRG
jgi:hypothetical protein